MRMHEEGTYASPAGSVGDVVEITVRIWRVVIDRGRNHAMLQRKARSDHLERAPRCKGLANHGFNRTDGDMICSVPEDHFNSIRFGLVVIAETYAMGIDIVDAMRRKSRLVEGGIDHARNVGAADVASDKLRTITRGAKPKHLRIYCGIPFLSVGELFQDDRACTFAQDNPIAM